MAGDVTTGRGGFGTRAAAGLAVAAIALLALMARPATSEAYVACGFAGGTLTVSMTESDDSARVIRRGGQIDVVVTNVSFEGESGGIAIACQGGPATIAGTDQIVFEDTPGTAYARGVVDLSGGPLAPGATPEADGTSEIEIRANMSGGRSMFQVNGTDSDDTLDLGRTAAGAAGINLNGAYETTPDVDVELNLVEIPIVDGEGGRDLIRGGGGTTFAAPISGVVGFVAAGGGGRDRIFGGDTFNIALGGDGRDRLFGARFTDFMDGGDHRDLVQTGKGRDFPSGGDGHDKVRCGPGHDYYSKDGGRRSRDKLKGCERIKNPRRVKVPRKIIRRFNQLIPALFIVEDDFYSLPAARSLSGSPE